MRLSGTKQARTLWICTVFILSLLPAGASQAGGGDGTAAPMLPKPGPAQTIVHQADMQQVLSVVEHRTADGKVLEKIQKKLITLGDRELHLAASLCKRIARDDHSVRANIAFSIVTAMIVLS